jgi:PKD repeat protein
MTKITKLTILSLLILILLPTINPTIAASPFKITVKTEKTSYQLWENVEISGNVTYNDITVDQGLAGIQVKSPLGSILTRTKMLGPIGTQTFKIEIQQVTLCDQNGNPQQAVIRGGNAFFRVKIKNNDAISTIQVTATATIYSNESIPLGILSRQTSIPPGGILDFWQNVYIEPWVKNGTGTIYANVYSDWPENNGYPLCPEKIATFAILESEYDETTPASPQETTYQNGTYNVDFTLSPEPYPGTYFVYATAWYKGWKTDQPALTTFQVIDVEAPPRASFVIKPPMVGPGYQAVFDASSSTAEGYNDTITSYFWDFGDGQNATGKIVYHTYPNIGNYTVTLNITDTEGYWNTTSKTAIVIIIHDVAVTTVSCLNTVYNDWLVQVTVKAKNLGTITENFNITLYANETFAAKAQVSSLGPQLSTTITLTWNTTGLIPRQNYTVKAVADTLINETKTADNILEYGLIFVRMMGDTRFDGKIDILDVVVVTSLYGKKSTDPEWNIMADLNPDGKIDILDVVKVTSKYGQTY